MQHIQKGLLTGAAIAFIAVIGAAIYEHLAIVPVWSAAPPRSLAMFNGPYAIRPDHFWKMIHPLCLLLSIGALIACWRTGARASIAIMLAGYALILGVTAVYFVPELLRITGTSWSDTVSADLTRRAGLWEILSLLRLGVLLVLAGVLLNGFFRLTQAAPAGRTVAKDADRGTAFSAGIS